MCILYIKHPHKLHEKKNQCVQNKVHILITASTLGHGLPIESGKSHWEGGWEGSLHLNDSVELKTCVHTL